MSPHVANTTFVNLPYSVNLPHLLYRPSTSFSLFPCDCVLVGKSQLSYSERVSHPYIFKKLLKSTIARHYVARSIMSVLLSIYIVLSPTR